MHTPITQEQLVDELRETGGVGEEDIEVTLQLGQCITNIDNAAFPGLPIYVEVNCREDIHGAAYISPKGDEAERYVIYARGISGKVHKARQTTRVFLSCDESTTDLYREPLSISAENYMFAIAVHEARHRAQQWLPVLFSVDHGGSHHTLLRKIIEHIRLRFDLDREIYARQERSPEYVRRMTGTSEFDAQVVKKLAINKLVGGVVSIEELAAIVTLSLSE